MPTRAVILPFLCLLSPPSPSLLLPLLCLSPQLLLLNSALSSESIVHSGEGVGLQALGRNGAVSPPVFRKPLPFLHETFCHAVNVLASLVSGFGHVWGA